MKQAYEVCIPLGTVTFDDIQAESEAEARAIALERLVVEVVGDLWTPIGRLGVTVGEIGAIEPDVLADAAPALGQVPAGA